jgi:hypothetical protein
LLATCVPIYRPVMQVENQHSPSDRVCIIIRISNQPTQTSKFMYRLPCFLPRLCYIHTSSDFPNEAQTFTTQSALLSDSNVFLEYATFSASRER